MAQNLNERLGLIMSGGGARGAYEAGVVHFLRTGLPKPYRDIAYPIMCGASVGAINTCFLAATAHHPETQGAELYRLWSEVRQEDVYYRNFKALTNFLSNAFLGLSRNLTRFNPFASADKNKHHFRAIFDTAPFVPFLQNKLDWSQISKNAKNGSVKVVSLVATRMKTGKTEIFVQKKPQFEYIGPYKIREVDLDYRHAMASAAIPFIFPSVEIDHHYYVDGGVRLNTPLSPAVQFGANKLFIISLHSLSSDVMQRQDEAGLMKEESQPSIGEYLGKMLNGIFLDRLEYDLEQMNRINQIIERGGEVFGNNYLKKINQGLTKTLRTGEVVKRSFRGIRLIKISPSTPISDVFLDWFHNHRSGKPHFTPLENFLLRAFDINQEASMDLLSYLTFATDYLKMLLDLGYQDAKAKKDEIIDFFDQSPL